MQVLGLLATPLDTTLQWSSPVSGIRPRDVCWRCSRPESSLIRPAGWRSPSLLGLPTVWQDLGRKKGRKPWRCRGLNPGPHTCKACALPLSYIPFPRQSCRIGSHTSPQLAQVPSGCRAPLLVQAGPYAAKFTCRGRPALATATAALRAGRSAGKGRAFYMRLSVEP